MSRCRSFEVFVIPRMVFQRFIFYIFIIVFVSFDLKFKCNRLKTPRYAHASTRPVATFLRNLRSMIYGVTTRGETSRKIISVTSVLTIKRIWKLEHFQQQNRVEGP